MNFHYLTINIKETLALYSYKYLALTNKYRNHVLFVNTALIFKENQQKVNLTKTREQKGINLGRTNDTRKFP